MSASPSGRLVARTAAGILVLAFAGSSTKTCLADVIASADSDGTYTVVSPTTRSRAEVMKSFAEWQTSTLADPPNASVASWSADNGLLSERESGDGNSNRIKLNDLDVRSLRASLTGHWQFRARSISGRGNGFVGQLRADDATSQTTALQALQDIYDLAYQAQPSAAARTLVAPVPLPIATAPVAAAPMRADDPGDSQTPFGKKLPSILPLATDPSLDDACPYPKAARARGETGIVLLLVHVAADGSALDTAVDQSSGSASLDQATAACVKASGRFAIRRNGSKAVSYWGRMKFNWSFGA
jgi:TonB family protein